MSSEWIGLIGALGGVLLTGLIGLATALLTHIWQSGARRQERFDHLSEPRAELRRGAYARFLVASDALWEFVLGQPAQELDGSDLIGDVYERLRELSKSGEKQFDEFNASHVHVKLLCGADVEAELDTFHDWFVGRLATAMRESDMLKSRALQGLEAARQPLIVAMKTEQKIDLGFSST